MSSNRHEPQKPTKWLQDGFHRFLTPFLRRHFHAIAVDQERRFDRSIDDDGGLLVYCNHPSWWDPLIGHFLNRTLFPSRQLYAPIDAEALEQYRVFKRLGFFGVSKDAHSGSASFLGACRSILCSNDASLWVTPEGRFCDARDHSAELMPGVAHVCSRITGVTVLPLGLEYVFWDERLPVCLASLGEPFRTSANDAWSKERWQQELTDALRHTQSRLADLAMRRNSDSFDNLLTGKSGAGSFYDSFRKAKSLITRSRFRSSHGDQFQ